MKVIIIKKCDSGNVNDVVEVADGFAKNFLIKKGFAISYNESNAKKRTTTLKNQQIAEDKNVEIANKTKTFIENLKPVFSLKENNNVIHGSITRKQIVEELRKSGVKLPDSHNVENIKIESLGISPVKIKIYKNIIATLKVEVRRKNV